MLGKTNLLFVDGNQAMDLVFDVEYILTSSSSSILKIEYINNLFFVFTSDNKVLYGSTIESMQLLKNGEEFIAAKHIIFADNVYYMTTIEDTVGEAVILKTVNLISYEKITLKTGTDSYKYPVHGLFLKSSGEIVALIDQYSGGRNDYNPKYLLIVNTLLNYDESNVNFIELTTMREIYGRAANDTAMRKDRIFTYIYSGSSTNTYGIVITLDGNVTSCNNYNLFVAGWFFRLQNDYGKKMLYYSLNGVDYMLVDFFGVNGFSAETVFEYDGNIVLLYSCMQDSTNVYRLCMANSPSGLADAINDSIPYTKNYNLFPGLYLNDAVYLGCTGGIIAKGRLTYSDKSRPDVATIKHLSAKQALAEAKVYTNEQLAALEARILALEAFHQTE